MASSLFIIFLLICINGIFAMSEIALVSARKSRLETAAKKGDKRAKMALQLQANPTKLLSTVQFGITLTSILTGIFSGQHIKDVVEGWFINLGIIEEYAGSIALGVVVVIITTVSLVIGELVPKRIGLSFPEGISKAMAPVMIFIALIAKPFIFLLSRSSDFIIRLLRIKASDDEHVTEEEIKTMIQEGTETGEIEEIEQDIVERVFHLGDRKIRSLMTHRNEIIWLDANEPTDKIRDDIESEIHSIYPVCDGELDKTLGIVYIKDLFLANTRNNFNTIREFIKPILFLPENNTAYSALEKFKESKVHYALVMDEYGAVQGLVTINDILEALVGEFDELNIPDYSITERRDGTYLVDAGIPFYDFLKYFEIEEFDDLQDHDFNTLAGFIVDKLEHIPKEGEIMKWKDYEFEIIDMDASRIDKILFKQKR